MKSKAAAKRPTVEVNGSRPLTAAIYARVSTADQHNDMQFAELRGYCQRLGWKVIEYAEKMSSVKKRPVFDQLLADARLRKFDVVVVWKLDRFARSMKHFIDSVMDLDHMGIRFVAPTQGIDTDKQSPTGRFLMHILAAFAELERNMIVERTKAGVAEYRRAFQSGEIGKSRHSRSGRDLPSGRPQRVFRRDLAQELRAKGLSWRAISRELGVPQATIRLALQRVQKVVNFRGKKALKTQRKP